MKTIPFLSLFSLLIAVAAADAPKKPILSRYTKLWSDSPFTAKPPPINNEPEDNPLEDYALGGISKLSDGYFAILFNKKKPDEKIVITPGSPSEFEVVDVKWNNDNWKETVAVIRHGRNTGTVSFDEKLLTVKASAAGKKPTGKTDQGRGKSGVPGQPASSGRTPRPRVVVPQKR